METFIPEDRVRGDEVLRGELASGTLTAWRVDDNGRQWYRRMPDIIGTPKAPLEYDYDEIPAIEADDTTTPTGAERRLQMYRDIVERRAAGEDIDAEYGNDILELAGKTMDDFNADVAEVRALDMELGNGD